MTDYPNSELSDDDLTSLIREFWHNNPDVGESMATGLLRALGYRVTRARIRNALRLNDPLSVALRWPGITRRRVYSVAGPNSLWHVGMYMHYNHSCTVLLYPFPNFRFPSQTHQMASDHSWGDRRLQQTDSISQVHIQY